MIKITTPKGVLTFDNANGEVTVNVEHSGCLTVRDSDGGLLAAIAAGQWHTYDCGVVDISAADGVILKLPNDLPGTYMLPAVKCMRQAFGLTLQDAKKIWDFPADLRSFKVAAGFDVNEARRIFRAAGIELETVGGGQ